MFRDAAQSQARHRIRGEGKQQQRVTKSLRNYKQNVHVMGVLGMMHEKFGGARGGNAVVHSMFETIKGAAFGDPEADGYKKAKEKAAERIYIAAMTGDEAELQKALEPFVAAYAEYDEKMAEYNAAAEAAAAEAAAAAAAAASPAKTPAKGKKGAPEPEPEFVPQLTIPDVDAPQPPIEPRWCLADARGVEPLALAASRGHAGCCKLLLDAKAAVGAAALTCGRTALHRAAEEGHVETVTALLDAKADVASCQRDGQCALFSAAAHGHADVVAYLLSEDVGAHVDQVDVLGVTPLIAAAEAGFSDVCTALLEARALLDHDDDKGWTALHYAVAAGHMQTAMELVKAGASAGETRGGQPLTALHTEVGESIVEFVKERDGDDDDDDDDEGSRPVSPRPYTAPP